MVVANDLATAPLRENVSLMIAAFIDSMVCRLVFILCLPEVQVTWARTAPMKTMLRRMRHPRFVVMLPKSACAQVKRQETSIFVIGLRSDIPSVGLRLLPTLQILWEH